ncbi:S8 family serine peptidase [Hymenobacter rubripertinctus]|uniref:T9SS C-terminal target domain-containing protein n=1 Tax=Hymenobacter rubripertinctus TaxID=2029981 RepID=A0A418R2U0_9BACT|nr:S8 family serine peptidase [Hymenobacter rubripertinctus]RIY11752.1 T9SS C-terminal target domain-containing protein [Hymenobacter rubripertinctus]
MSTAVLRHAGRLLLLLWLSSAGTPLRSAAQPGFRAVSRLAPGLRPGGETAWLRVSVTNETAFRQWLARTRPGATSQAEPRHAGLLRVRGIAPEHLATCPWVSFVEAADRVARPERELGGTDFGANKVTAVQGRYPALTGAGLTVSIKESPLDLADIDFKGRLLNPDPLAPLLNAHATIMATLIAGAGNSAPSGRGVAWQARIAQSSYDNLLPDDGAQLAAQAVSVQNHSYGVAVENFYGLEARAYDQQARQYPNLLHVFSSGNSGDQPAAPGAYAALPGVSNLTGEFKNAKNSLSVGATDALGAVSPRSSRGPAADGRVKPELVAFGDGGTSDAAALVSGISLLVQQAHQQQRGTLPSAALVKAVLLNTADDTGAPQVDFVAGYGQVDALGAVQTMLAGRFVEDVARQGQEQVFRLTVPAGIHRLKLTLAWTDAEAAANAAPALVNDLDLTLHHPASGQSWLPWTLNPYPHPDSLAQPARRRPNHLDNAEQITLDAPVAGTYELRVHGYQLTQGSQPFSVAYEFETGLSWISPTKTHNLGAAGPELVRWQWAGPATPARLEYRPLGQSNWQVLSTALDLTAQTFRWTTPDTTQPGQLRLVAGTTTVVSDTFFVARPLRLGVGYSCGQEALLTWRRVPGASAYQVYALGATHLSPLRLVADTALLLSASEVAARYFAVAPVIRGRAGERGSTEDLQQASNGCYVRSFLPRQLVTDTVRFDLTLGSGFRLRTITLQRRRPDDGRFEDVQTLPAGAATALVLTDAAPLTGYAQYRARLSLADGTEVYSQPERVFRVVDAAAVLVYPVPVVVGEPLRIVLPPEQTADVRLYDLAGRLHSAPVAEVGTIKRIATGTLRPGTYLLRISLRGGATITRRITVL